MPNWVFVIIILLIWCSLSNTNCAAAGVKVMQARCDECSLYKIKSLCILIQSLIPYQREEHALFQTWLSNYKKNNTFNKNFMQLN